MKYTSRKLLFFTLSLGLIVWLVSRGTITAEVFGNCFWAIAAGYTGGNVGEHFATRTK